MSAEEQSSGFAGRRLHFIAIGGAGMSGLALVCHELGAVVSGSDRAESTYMARLRDAGLQPRLGHDAEAVPADADVVVSTAIADDNPELVRARERGQRVLHRGELLAELTSAGRLIAIAGAHGKTTTSGMIVHALRAAGADPGFVLGGELPGAGPDGERAANAGWGEDGVIVAEADESDGSFLRLRPEVAVITNVELDHHSHWSGEAELRQAFVRFCAGAAAVVAPAGDPLARAGAPTTFGVEGDRGDTGGVADPDFAATSIRAVEGGSAFALRTPDGSLEVRLGLPGRHNVANATAALAALAVAGAGERLPPLPDLVAGLASFPGMARRLERKGERAGAPIYDDYAHHPTEVAAAIAALRELPHRRLIVVFQPHLYSRTRALAARFGRALAAADVVGVLDVYAAREQPVGELEGVSGLAVVRAAAQAAGGKRVLWLREMAVAERLLGPELGPGDILVTLGAGDVFELAERLAAAAPAQG
jgi:UDP-N-acetylmuramate--alanine ligase